MNEPIHILVVDDSAIVRNALRALFATEPGLEVVGEAANGAEAVLQSHLLQPDLILMDLLLPGQDGTAAIEAIKAENPRLPILVLTAEMDNRHLCAALVAGASGYVLKSSLPQVLIEAIYALYQSEILQCSVNTTAEIRYVSLQS